MKKITLATLKSFIRKNKSNLKIQFLTHFDGMTDCVTTAINTDIHPIRKTDFELKHTLGIEGVWISLSKNYIEAVPNGYNVSNSCGSFNLTI